MEGKNLQSLRQDLRLHRDPDRDTGWLVEDPIRNQYFRLSARAVGLLFEWAGGTKTGSAKRLSERCAEPPDKSEIEGLLGFLEAQELLENGDEAKLLRRISDGKQLTLKRVLHAYLFFRRPLIRPRVFIEWAWPFVRPLFSRGFTTVTLLAATLGLWLVGRKWETFSDTFASLLTWEGAALYGLSLIVLKILHEFGHAFMAHRYGASVPAMGIAVMLMAPVLYTDTTAAWRLPRRQRFLIDAGGVMVELAIAAYATLAWALMPDGPARSIAYTLATLSWIMSLVVNLNPLMRFDGYYLFSDLISVENLQQRSFALARWQLRECLFGLGERPPEHFEKRKRRLLIAHAYATWIYRFFLFLGIAIFVYHAFAKLLGISLFLFEIATFVLRPLIKEFRVWWTFRRRVRMNRRSAATLVILVAACAFLFLPWQTTVRAPAVLRASQVSDIHLPTGAQIERIERVNAYGYQMLSFIAVDADLQSQMDAAHARLALAQMRLARVAADPSERSSHRIFEQRVSAAQAEIENIQRKSQGLRITSPGRDENNRQLVWTSQHLHEGLWIGPSEKLATTISTDGLIVMAAVEEAGLERLRIGASARFVPEEIERPTRRGYIARLPVAPIAAIDLPLLSGAHGGPVAVNEIPGLGPVPTRPHYTITVILDSQSDVPARELRGTVLLEAEPRSLMGRYMAHAISVLIRELTF